MPPNTTAARRGPDEHQHQKEPCCGSPKTQEDPRFDKVIIGFVAHAVILAGATVQNENQETKAISNRNAALTSEPTPIATRRITLIWRGEKTLLAGMRRTDRIRFFSANLGLRGCCPRDTLRAQPTFAISP